MAPAVKDLCFVCRRVLQAILVPLTPELVALKYHHHLKNALSCRGKYKPIKKSPAQQCQKQAIISNDFTEFMPKKQF